MIQRDFYLDTPDGKKIFCAIDSASEETAPKALVLSHGLTGHPMEHMHMEARSYFVDRGYDVYRFAYYWDGDDTRKLDECTVASQAHDLTQIIDMVKPQHDKVFCAGHSYGGLTLLHANPDIAALSFWDASYVPTWFEDEAVPLKDTPYFTLSWGSRHLINPKMVAEAKALDEAACKSLANAISAPAQIVIAPETNRTPWRKELYNHINSPKEYSEIAGADHCFTNGDTLNALLKETHEWFEKF